MHKDERTRHQRMHEPPRETKRSGDSPRRHRDYDEHRHRSSKDDPSPHCGRDIRSRSRSLKRDRDGDDRRRRSRSRSRSRSLEARRRSPSPPRKRRRSRSGSVDSQRHSRDRRRSRSRSRSRDRRERRKRKDRSRSSSSDSNDPSSRRKKDRRKDKESKRSKSKERRREKKREKKEKKEKKKHGPSASHWGKYGVITEADIFNKAAEFHTWLVEERKINPETITKDQSKKEFAKYVEDFNTATLPHEKYYHIEAYERRMSALRSGEFVPPPDDTYDPRADIKAINSAHKKKVVDQDSYLSKEQLMELRKVQHERIEAGKMKLLGMEVKQNMGVRMDGSSFE